MEKGWTGQALDHGILHQHERGVSALQDWIVRHLSLARSCCRIEQRASAHSKAIHHTAAHLPKPANTPSKFHGGKNVRRRPVPHCGTGLERGPHLQRSVSLDQLCDRSTPFGLLGLIVLKRQWQARRRGQSDGRGRASVKGWRRPSSPEADRASSAVPVVAAEDMTMSRGWRGRAGVLPTDSSCGTATDA